MQHAVAVSSPIHNLTDWQASRISAFVARYPEYRRLPPDVLLQYADTYRDDADHALEQEYRDNGVLLGCRADYKRADGVEWGWVPFSDCDCLGAS